MYFKYKVGSDTKDFFFSDFRQEMSFYRDGVGWEENMPIQTDENGEKFFVFEGNKIMFNDFVCPTPQEFVNNIGNYHSEDLCQILMRYGMESIIIAERVKKMDVFNFGNGVIIGFESHSSADKDEDFNWVDYKFVPEYLCMPEDNYKLRMYPKDDALKGVYPSRHYYVSDLVSLVAARPDMFQVKTNVAITA